MHATRFGSGSARGALALILCLSLGCSGTPAAGSAPDVGDALHVIREKHKLPGIVALALRDGRIAFQGADGVRMNGFPEKITIDDQVHLGSCTKSMTATMIATLVDEGHLRWTTTVGESFPALTMDPGWRGVTLEQLLCHRGGAPADIDPALWAKLWSHPGTPTEQRRTLVEALLAKAPETPGNWSYSNAGYALAGVIAEQSAGRPWEQLMQERLFKPLGMTSAGFGAPGEPGAITQPRGHNQKRDPVEPGPGSDNPAAIGPAGTAHASLPDWAKYVQLHLTGGPLLKPETLAYLHRPPEGPDPKYASGWIVVDRSWGGGKVLMHNGSNTMWFAVAWLAPKRNLAILVATNIASAGAEQGCDEAATMLLERLGR